MKSVTEKLFSDKIYLHSDITASVFGVNCINDVSYLDAGVNSHTLDIFTPVNANAPSPLIVSVHNEGFIRENKNYDNRFCAYLASKGFCVISVKVPPAKSSDYRSLIEDVTDAFIFIEKNASSYGADLNNSFLCADSTGANIALISLCVNKSELLADLFKIQRHTLSFKAFGLSSPVTEISDFLTDPFTLEIKKALFGDKIKNNPFYIFSSYKSLMEYSMFRLPMYIVSSKDDPLNIQSLNLSSLCRKRDINHKFRYCESGRFYKLPHAFNVLFPEYAESLTVNNEMLEFFKSFIENN